MEQLAREEYLVFLRCRQYQIPISAAALEKYISRFYGGFFEKYGLPTIPIFLFERSDHMRNCYGIFAHSGKDAVAIALNIGLFDGLNADQLTDILLHEGCHYHTWFFHGSTAEAPDGHSAEFYRFCAEVGCRPEKSSTHRTLYVKEHVISYTLTEEQEAFLAGNIAAAKEISAVECLCGDSYARHLPFQAFLAWYTGESSSLLASLDDLEVSCIKEDKDALAAWSWLSYKADDNEARRWGYLMHLKEAARMGSTLAAFAWGKILIEGDPCGLKPCLKKGLFYLEKAARKHMPSAMKLFGETLIDLYDLDASLQTLRELIALDVGDPPLDLISGGDAAVFVPYF